MCPEFFHIGPFAIRAYGLTLALSFFIGLSFIRREAVLLDVHPERTVNLGYVLIAFGVLGARLGYVAYHWDEFSGSLLSIINPFGSGERFGIAGLNLQTGMVLAFLAGWVYLYRRGMSLPATLDAVVPAVAFGVFVTRIGCYLNGCCFGVQTDLPWGAHFPPGSPAYSVFASAAIHPAQLYSSAYGLALFFLLRWVNRHRHGIGMTTAVFFMVEAAFRFGIEFVRYYESAMWFDTGTFRVTYNQLAAAGLFAVGVLFWLHARNRAVSSPQSPAAASESP